MFNFKTQFIIKDLKKQLLNSGLLDGLKTEVESTSLLKELHCTAFESMLQVAHDAHLGYSKNEKRKLENNTKSIFNYS